MKKWISILCMVALLAAMAGCSERETAPEDEEQDSGQETETVIDDTPPTMEEAQAFNSQINDADINLVQFQDPRSGDPIAIVQTSMGDITIRLFPDQAPMAVANFIGLAEDGFYNGKRFHLAERNVMVQTGSLDNNGEGGSSIYTNENGEIIPFATEYSTDLWHFRGAVSMYNDGSNTNLSQFFIVQAEQSLNSQEELEEAAFPNKVIDRYMETGGAPYLDFKNTIFGQVIEGLDVVDAINEVERSTEIDLETGEEVEGTRPTVDVIITGVEITTY